MAVHDAAANKGQRVNRNVEDATQGLASTLDAAIDSIKGNTITLRQLLGMIGEQGLLVLCAMLTIPFLLPVSIPGVSTVFGAAIILIGFGIAFNRLPWLPRWLLDRDLDADKLRPVLLKGAATVRKIDGVIRPRLVHLTTAGLAGRVNGLAIVFSAILLAMPLGLIPFSNTLPGIAILFLASGMSQRDGVFVLLGYGMIFATIIYFGVLAWIAFVAGQGISAYFL